MIPDHIKERKGASKREDVPSEVLHLLNTGKIPSVNLTEWLATDQLTLLENFMRVTGNDPERFRDIASAVRSLPKRTVVEENKAIGKGFYQVYPENERPGLLKLLKSNKSDAVRGWAAYLIASEEAWPLEKKLEEVQDLAADSHFGVREIAWLAVRPEMIEKLEIAINQMEKWAMQTDENIRRFAVESLRPRGVWCAHIPELKEKPHLMTHVLDRLRSDPARYVQDSVANWLNDASKSDPEWVRATCERWLKDSPVKETEYIVKKALRTIRKQEKTKL